MVSIERYDSTEMDKVMMDVLADLETPYPLPKEAMNSTKRSREVRISANVFPESFSSMVGEVRLTALSPSLSLFLLT
jgi:hypothetical protein